MLYHYVMPETPGHRAEVGRVSTHVEAAGLLWRANRERRPAMVSVELRNGARAEIGRSFQPEGKRKPWTWSILEPTWIRAFHPTVLLGVPCASAGVVSH